MLFILSAVFLFFCSALLLNSLSSTMTDVGERRTQHDTVERKWTATVPMANGGWEQQAGWAEQKTLFLSKLNCLKQIFLILHPRSSFSPLQPPLLVRVLFNIRSLFYLHSFSLFYTIKIHFYLFSISPSPRCCVHRSSEFDCRLFNSSAKQEAWSGDDTAASRQGRFHRISNRGTLKRIQRIEMNFNIAKKYIIKYTPEREKSQRTSLKKRTPRLRELSAVLPPLFIRSSSSGSSQKQQHQCRQCGNEKWEEMLMKKEARWLQNLYISPFFKWTCSNTHSHSLWPQTDAFSSSALSATANGRHESSSKRVKKAFSFKFIHTKNYIPYKFRRFRPCLKCRN